MSLFERNFRPKKESGRKFTKCHKCPKCGSTPAWYPVYGGVILGCYKCSIYIYDPYSDGAHFWWEMYCRNVYGTKYDEFSNAD